MIVSEPWKLAIFLMKHGESSYLCGGSGNFSSSGLTQWSAELVHIYIIIYERLCIYLGQI